jgi:hypothetical protein
VKEKPILFKGEMVRAILAGNKTQTRRVIKDTTERKGPANPAYMERWKDDKGWAKICPYGQVGDRLWVRESLELNEYCEWSYKVDGSYVSEPVKDPSIKYKWERNKKGDQCRSIHMPRWASRITLEITNVRIEHLNDISEDDAKAEGVTPSIVGDNLEHLKYRAGFNYLWQTINAKTHPWDSNPWVFVISFEVIK